MREIWSTCLELESQNKGQFFNSQLPVRSLLLSILALLRAPYLAVTSPAAAASVAPAVLSDLFCAAKMPQHVEQPDRLLGQCEGRKVELYVQNRINRYGFLGTSKASDIGAQGSAKRHILSAQLYRTRLY